MKIPVEINKVIKLFHSHNLTYNLFKCEHIFAGENSNLDILFLQEKDYQEAGNLLRSLGYLLYLPEKIEKYKQMYVQVIDGELFSIHLHREIGWHNLKILDKKPVFNKAKKIKDHIFVPSDEDQLIIHLAHIIYENLKIRTKERKFIENLIEKELDWKYIKDKTKTFQKPAKHILSKIKAKKQTNRNVLISALLKKALTSPYAWPSLSIKVLRNLTQRISWKRKGCLISLIGVNGTGKTTLCSKLLKQYHPTTSFFHGQTGYYFGWKPFSPYAKLIARILKKKEKKIFKEVNKEIKPKKSIFKELILIYNFLEYLQRYLFVIYPKLRKGKLVITDRYFYDLYGQYNYAPASLIIKSLLKLFPQPDCLFILDAQPEIILKRGKNPNDFSNIKKEKTRKGIDITDISNQRKRYLYLQKHLQAELINTEDQLTNNIQQIIKKTWKTLVLNK